MKEATYTLRKWPLNFTLISPVFQDGPKKYSAGKRGFPFAMVKEGVKQFPSKPDCRYFVEPCHGWVMRPSQGWLSFVRNHISASMQTILCSEQLLGTKIGLQDLLFYETAKEFPYRLVSGEKLKLSSTESLESISFSGSVPSRLAVKIQGSLA